MTYGAIGGDVLSSSRRCPCVSVITPSYNQGRYLEETIRSVKCQTYPAVEHIVVDGGSRDSTLRILREYESSYNMKWLSERDRGQADAVNKGLERARGDIIGWLNSDDAYFSSSVIADVVEMFAENEDVDVIYGDVALITWEGVLLRIEKKPGPSLRRLLCGNYIAQPAAFVRAEAFKEERLDTLLYYSMDYELWLRLMRKGYRFLHTRRVLAADRCHSARKSVQWNDVRLNERRRIQSQHGSLGWWIKLALRPYYKADSGLRRLAGLRDLLHLYAHNGGRFAFAGRLNDSLTSSIGTQLLGKKRQFGQHPDMDCG